MPLYKFGPNDIFHNVLKTYPESKFFIYSGSIYYKNKPAITGSHVTNVGHVSTGFLNLYELNVDRPSGELIYPYVTKGGSSMAPRTISTQDFQNVNKFGYGDTLTGSYPLSASISKEYYALDGARKRITALKNTLNYYTPLSQHYDFSSSLGDKATQALGLVSIPSIFYGSAIKKGSVNLKFYLTGTLIGELSDENQRGELIQTGPVNSEGSGSVAGVVLYNEGFLVLTGSWALDTSATDVYDSGADSPRWRYFGQSMSGSIIAVSSSFSLGFKGTNHVPVTTMLAHAPVGRLNHSSNPTFIEYGQVVTPTTGAHVYIENEKLNIKNTVSSAYADPTGSFKKQTFISKIGIYDDKKNLIGIAKLATPVKKTEERDFTFKLKLDF